MTQIALARLLSESGLAFHQQTVQRIENGERPVRLNEAVLIVQALGMGRAGELGLDAAIDPQRSVETAYELLLAAVERVDQLLVAADLARWTALERVEEAIADLELFGAAYLGAFAEHSEGQPDETLLHEAQVKLKYLSGYRGALTGWATPSWEPR